MLAAVGVLALIMLVVLEPAGAAFPGQNGKIVFSSNRDGNYEIYTMNANGQGIEDRLTNNLKGGFSPDWQSL